MSPRHHRSAWAEGEVKIMPDDGWYGVAAPNERILEFLHIFSRFEYALKVTGFLEGDENDPRAAWDCFARDVLREFQAARKRDEQFQAAVNYLLANPPKKLIRQRDGLIWKLVQPEQGVSDSENVLKMVRRVRNNLFHGGKYLPDTTADVDRDRQVIDHSLIILHKCVALRSNVHGAYRK